MSVTASSCDVYCGEAARNEHARDSRAASEPRPYRIRLHSKQGLRGKMFFRSPRETRERGPEWAFIGWTQARL